MTIPEPFSTKTFSFPGIRANTWRCKHPLHRATGGALLALLLLLVLVFAIPSPANATQATRGDNSWYVGPGGDFQTIQEAVDVAGEGDLIVIANGSYPENVVSGKYLRLKGNSSEDTILSGNPADSENHSILSGPLQLENLTVTAEGYQSHRNVTGIQLLANHQKLLPEGLESLTLRNLTVTNVSQGIHILGQEQGRSRAEDLVTVSLETLIINASNTGLLLEDIQSNITVTESTVAVQNIGIQAVNSSWVMFVSNQLDYEGEAPTPAGIGILCQESSLVQIHSNRLIGLDTGMLLENSSCTVGSNDFRENNRALVLDNGSATIIASNRFVSSIEQDIVLRGENSENNNLGKNAFEPLGREPKISVQSGKLLPERHYLNIMVRGGDNSLLSGGEVLVNNSGTILYATPLFDGIQSQTVVGGIGNHQVTVRNWEGDGLYSNVDTWITVHYENWTQRTLYSYGDDTPVLFTHPLFVDATVDPDVLKDRNNFFKEYDKSTGRAQISIWVDNLLGGAAPEMTVEIYQVAAGSGSETLIHNGSVELKPYKATELLFNHSFRDGDYNLKIVLNRNRAVYETNTDNNIIASDTFTVKVEEDSNLNSLILYLAAGGFLLLVFIFFGILLTTTFQPENEGEEGSLSRGKNKETKRLLVCFRELETRIGLKRELEQEGYVVSLAKNNFELQEHIEEKKYHGALLSPDIEDSSLERLVAKLRLVQPGFPVVVLSQNEGLEVPEGSMSYPFRGKAEDMKNIRKLLRQLVPHKTDALNDSITLDQEEQEPGESEKTAARSEAEQLQKPDPATTREAESESEEKAQEKEEDTREQGSKE